MTDLQERLGARARLGAAALVVAMLTACGGGGGDDSSAAATAQSKSDPTQALALTTENGDAAAVLGLSIGDLLLALGQSEVTSTQTLLSGADATQTTSCSNGGTVQLTWTDMNGDGHRGLNESVSIQYKDCLIEPTRSVLTGTVLVSVSGSVSQALNVTLDYGSGLQLTDQSDGSQSRVLGTMNAAMTDDGLTRKLLISSSSRDDLRLTAPYQSGDQVVQDTEQLTDVQLEKTLSREHAKATIKLSFQLSSVYLGGTIRVSTPVALSSEFDTYPNSGEVNVRSVGTAVARLKANFVTNSDQAAYEFDANGDGVPDDEGYGAWNYFTTGAMWWGEGLGAQRQFTPNATRTYSSNQFAILNSQVQSVAGGQLPKLSVQFSHELASGSVPQFQLLRVEYDHGDPYFWDSAKTPVNVEIKGAYMTLTAAQPLQHGHSYILQAVDANGQVLNPIAYKDQLGNTLTDGGRTFNVDNTLSASIALPTDAPVLAPGRAITLSSAPSQSTRGISSYRWTQISGATLAFSDLDKPTTSISLSNPTATNSTATVQLQITDANGEIEYTRKVITVIGDPTHANFLYMNSQPGDYIGQGQQKVYMLSTNTFSDSTPDSSFLRYYDYNPTTGDFWTVDLAGNDGQPIHAGSYENAQRASFRGGANGLDIGGDGRGCNTVTGRFDVLEVAYGSDGKVTRLAVDFEQHCEGMTPALFGSFRFKSSVPVRP